MDRRSQVYTQLQWLQMHVLRLSLTHANASPFGIPSRAFWIPMGVICLFNFISQVSNAQDTEYRGTGKKLSALLASGVPLSPAHLVLVNEDVSPRDFGVIKKHCSIESIVWGEFPDGVNLTNDSLRSLTSFTTLKELSVYASAGHALDWGELGKLTNLKNLSLIGNISFPEDSLRTWSQLVELESLELDGEFESPKCFAFLDNLKDIRSFKLNTKTANLEFLEIVRRLKSLKRLELNNVEGVSSEQLTEMARAFGPNLEELAIILNDDMSLEHLKLFPRLQHLQVTWSVPTKVDFQFLAGNPKLTSVVMYRAIGETSTILNVVKTHKTLQRIIVSPELSTSRALFWEKEKASTEANTDK